MLRIQLHFCCHQVYGKCVLKQSCKFVNKNVWKVDTKKLILTDVLNVITLYALESVLPHRRPYIYMLYTYKTIHLYIYICVCVCLCVCIIYVPTSWGACDTSAMMRAKYSLLRYQFLYACLVFSCVFFRFDACFSVL